MNNTLILCMRGFILNAALAARYPSLYLLYCKLWLFKGRCFFCLVSWASTLAEGTLWDLAGV